MRHLAGFLALLAACRHAPAPSGTFSERRLATLPEGVEVRFPPAFTADGSAVAYIAHTDGGDWVVRGEWKSRRLDAI